MNESSLMNLTEILKPCIGGEFFSPCWGNVLLSEVTDHRIVVTSCANSKKHTLTPCGTHISSPALSCVMLYPSVGSFQNHVLNSDEAWREWYDEVFPKPWRAKKGETYYSITSTMDVISVVESGTQKDNYLWEIGNYFEISGLACEVRDCMLAIFRKTRQDLLENKFNNQKLNL